LAKAVPILARIHGVNISILAPTRHKYFSWPVYCGTLLSTSICNTRVSYTSPFIYQKEKSYYL